VVGLIFARSNRSTYLFATGSLAVALGLALMAAGLLIARYRAAALLLAMLAAVAAAVLARALRRLRRWPVARLGLFRDRLVLMQGPVELQARWDMVDTATLADQGDWAAARWPEIRLTDRLTVRLRPARRFSFRPAAYGLEPVACRDLILRLRDERGLRAKLPEFDSVLDLSARPLHTGELIRPQL
jgi:hypothetical protein